MNPFPGRRRTFQAVKKPTENIEAIQEIVLPQAASEAPRMSFKGLKACPACGKEMTRGLYLHYMKKHG